MILIAVGANLPGLDGGTPLSTCLAAVERVILLPGVTFVAVSHWYRSRPVPRDDDQPDYCNGVVRLAGTPDPAVLLAALHDIEAALGRVRGVANQARTVDLDLIDLNGMVRPPPPPPPPPPLLPHPRAHQRAFVLRPIMDVAADWVHPVLGVGAKALLEALAPSDLVRW